MLNLINEIQKGFNGDAWHGNHAMQILNNVQPEKAFQHPVPGAHSIAEIALHMTGWTEEVTARLLGKVAGDPAPGDWPEPEAKTAKYWEKIIFDFKIANEELIRQCGLIEERDWDEPTKDERDPAKGTGVTFSELISGLAQHHAYHAGQISLLTKF